MLVRNLPLTVLKVVKKEGTGKTSGKPYAFNVASVVDEDANVFQFNVADDLAREQGDVFPELRNSRIEADIRFLPKGFDVGGTLMSFRLLD